MSLHASIHPVIQALLAVAIFVRDVIVSCCLGKWTRRGAGGGENGDGTAAGGGPGRLPFELDTSCAGKAVTFYSSFKVAGTGIVLSKHVVEQDKAFWEFTFNCSFADWSAGVASRKARHDGELLQVREGETHRET